MISTFGGRIERPLSWLELFSNCGGRSRRPSSPRYQLLMALAPALKIFKAPELFNDSIIESLGLDAIEALESVSIDDPEEDSI